MPLRAMSAMASAADTHYGIVGWDNSKGVEREVMVFLQPSRPRYDV